MDDFDFGPLKNKSRIIDDKLKKLEKIWESPQNILCHRGENIEEAEKMFANFVKPIKQIHDELIEDIAPRADYLKDMDRFLLECETACDQLTQDLDDIETLFSEYGYVKPDSINQSHIQVGNDENIDPNSNNSILNLEEMEHLTIDSPIVGGSNGISSDSTSVCNDTENFKPKYFATPMIKSVASIVQTEFSKNSNIHTPMNRYPREPIYSPYYYKKM